MMPCTVRTDPLLGLNPGQAVKQAQVAKVGLPMYGAGLSHSRQQCRSRKDEHQLILDDGFPPKDSTLAEVSALNPPNAICRPDWREHMPQSGEIINTRAGLVEVSDAKIVLCLLGL
ncbi:hypothetical protein JMJ77_0006443 [Colletotrichum scovillei]|uniref:Uncharacterized protein n=1 Tax=Colletotrichum scovillei TaxID=1209932 RepID=A0A9P7RLB6_9PEZI|nr:hypothetical protein JMJ77_0006443 [Colletotrichum scovillei]KAG7077643.1 hypothetical protein JMJ76_0014888 [Colletotrichum scovillei]KAG7084728.1 hypothetical protein JMJ78_0010160 [Colletotrichum scovillei]